MYQLSVLQNQWLILAFFGGVVLTLGVVAAYLMMWRPRNDSPEPITSGRDLAGWIPWIVIILFIVIVIYQIASSLILSPSPTTPSNM